MDAIKISGVSKRYGDLQALNNVSFEIQQGEFFGLLGPNGAGKSTLISALAGLLKTDSGQLSIMGHDVGDDYRLARQALGVVPQEIVMDPFFTVRETLEFQSGYYGIRNNGEWIDELLLQLGLSDKADSNMRQLSGGMKRRVLIAQALVHKPQVLVLDEPTAGVDVELRQSMWRFVRRLHREGHTIVLTTHYLEEAEELCDRIAIINKGEVIALETKEDLLARGLGSKLMVRSKDVLGELPQEFQSKVVRLDGCELELALNRDSDSVMQILDTLRDSGVDIEFVSVINDSLEDVFVRMTGSSEGEAK
ncbi:ABC transporter ATP-binding protein [Arenicella sp. 4NH20-0111]|uniref:ABC transporter ATP-binding protein n=1 Tax=Arenicella sp. 4NH20-0111 TaxID=3127648 RepID=UPI003342C0A8